MIKIRIAEFTTMPGGRYEADGPGSGQEFRRRYLEPHFAEGRNREQISVNLDGALGYATSFLEEVFGGLARQFGADQVLSRLQFVSDDEPLLVDEIKQYIIETKDH